MTFDELTRVAGTDWSCPDGWQQGKGAFGGLTLAVLARAAARGIDPSERPLRAISAEIPSAVMVGPSRVLVEPLRVGTGISTIAARMEQQGEVVAHAVCTFGKSRTRDLDRVELVAPELGAWTDAPAVPVGQGLPTFAKHLEYRPLRGIPFTAAKEAYVDGWVRMREPGDLPREIALVALVDAWWPALLPVCERPRPFGTVAFHAQLFDRASWTLDEPLFHRARLLASQDGFVLEMRELWTLRGELVAVNQQTIAVIK